MTKPSVSDCVIIDLPKFENRAGNISIAENINDFPFQIKRVFYIYDIPGGESRGTHAHKECQQFIISLSGAFDVEVNDGIESKSFRLDRPFKGLFIPAGIWAAEKDFSSGAVCLVLASDLFDEGDYLRDYDDYLTYFNNDSSNS